MINWPAIKNSLWNLANDSNDYWQWFTMAACFIAALAITKLLGKALLNHRSPFQQFLNRFFNPGERINGTPLVFCVLLWITWMVRSHWSATLVSKGMSPIPSGQIHTFTLLLSAYVVYQISNAISKGQVVPRILSGGLLITFAFHIFGWLTPISQALQNISIPLGDIDINLWNILSGFASLFLLLWLVSLANRFIDAAINSRHDIPSSIKVLISKTSRLTLYAVAFGCALKISGIPLGGLTFFSGALGVGIGFGLQKTIANLISGLIILVDKSIKPGDVIEIEGTFGWINSIHTRYVSVITRDRKEYLIPNEDFVTNKVINWSYSDRIIRIKADIGVAYDTDLPLAMRLCTDAVAATPRTLSDPPPVCLLKEFGDSSINLQIRFCIEDAVNGVSNVQSQVLLAIWQSFRDNNIEIPFPQRDIHIKSGTLDNKL